MPRILLLLLLIPLAAIAADPNPPTLYSDQGAWPIRRQWTPDEYRKYAQWVQHLYEVKAGGTYEQRNAVLPQLLKDSAFNLLERPEFLGEGGNPQLSDRAINLAHNVLDCGKLTAFLPGYYAYRRALPWMSARVRSGGGDVRTAEANVPVGSVNSFTSPSPYAFFRDALTVFSSGNYRVELDGQNAVLSDTVPVAINPDYMLPGCINYIDGHCLTLAKVDDYGEMHFLHASTTRGHDIYTYNGMNTVGLETPRYTGDTHWRDFYYGIRLPRFPLAETNSKGKVVNVRRMTFEELKPFGASPEQFELMHQFDETGGLVERGFRIERYLDLVRMRLRTKDVIRPVEFLEEYAEKLADIFRLRERFVQNAWENVRQNGPIAFPEGDPNQNIFQAHGRWETWSSPSSDVDRRNSYYYLRDWALYVVRWFEVNPGSVDMHGLGQYEIGSRGDLARALVAEKDRIFEQHAMEYMNSRGEPARLTLLEIEKRLHDLSFDPNHPPELRWGAPRGSAERASAIETCTPVPSGDCIAMERAYDLQAFYRNVARRETEMSFLRGMDKRPAQHYKFAEALELYYPLTHPNKAIREWLERREAKLLAPLEPRE
jgi:hypothetical protein